MISRRIIYPMVALAATAGGCTTFYIPPAAHIPLLSNSGEAHATGSTSGSTVDVQASWSPLPGLGILGAGMYAWDINNGGNTSRYGELMALYYLQPRGIFRMEAAAGMGTGSVDYVGNGEAGTFVEGGFNRYVAQVDVGLTHNLDGDEKRADEDDILLELGLSLRIAHLAPYGVEDIMVEKVPGPDPLPGATELPEGSMLRQTRTSRSGLASTFLEPAAMIRIGPQYLQLEGQILFSKDLGAFQYDHRSAAISLGLRMGLGKRTMF